MLPLVDPATITTPEFAELCRVFVLKHDDSAAQVLSQEMLACGLPSGTNPNQVIDQDVLTWITRKVIEYDAASA